MRSRREMGTLITSQCSVVKFIIIYDFFLSDDESSIFQVWTDYEIAAKMLKLHWICNMQYACRHLLSLPYNLSWTIFQLHPQSVAWSFLHGWNTFANDFMQEPIWARIFLSKNGHKMTPLTVLHPSKNSLVRRNGWTFKYIEDILKMCKYAKIASYPENVEHNFMCADYWCWMQSQNVWLISQI